MNRSQDDRTTVRWSRKTLVAAFFAIFWLVPFVVAAVAGAVAGDCSFTSECTDAETVGLLVAVIVVVFWALVAAPLTLILAVAWMLSAAGHRVRQRRQAASTPWPAPSGAERLPDVSVEAMLALDAGARHEHAGIPEEYLWVLAGVLWFVVLAGIAVATGDAWGLAIAGFAAIVAIPLTAMLVVSRVAHRSGRSIR